MDLFDDPCVALRDESGLRYLKESLLRRAFLLSDIPMAGHPYFSADERIMARVSTILITGANKGLGRETARRLITEGHDVWAAARDPERGLKAAEELGARPLVLDVTDDASVEAAARNVADATGGVLDVLINNAGISGGAIPIREETAAHAQTVYDVNVLGPIRMLHAHAHDAVRQGPSSYAYQFSRSWLYRHRLQPKQGNPDRV